MRTMENCAEVGVAVVIGMVAVAVCAVAGKIPNERGSTVCKMSNNDGEDESGVKSRWVEVESSWIIISCVVPFD